LVAVGHWRDSVADARPGEPGLAWQIFPGAWTELPNLAAEHAVFSGESPNLQANAQGFTKYAAVWDGQIDIPADGGYTFHLMDRDGARLVIDGVEVAKTGPPFAQVCGSPGNAMRYDRRIPSGRTALGQPGRATPVVGRPGAAADRCASCGV
jgi:hypothetical protein